MTYKSRVLTALQWSAGGKVLSQVFTWAVTLIVIRLLSPTDYGLLAMAMVFIGFFFLMSEIGLGMALVQAPKIDDRMLRQVFGAVILFDAGLYLLMYLSAPLFAAIFEEPRLTWVLRVLALQLLVAIFTSIPFALLTRNLEFKGQSLVELSAAIAGSLTTLVLAYAGFEVWALVGGSLVVAVWRAVGIAFVKPFFRMPIFSFAGTRGLLSFGGNVTLSRLLWYFYSQADMFIAGKLLGKELLGFYSVSMHLAALPVQKVSSIVNQVAFPAFSLIQSDPKAVFSGLLKALRVMSFFAFPALWGISSIAGEIVDLILGPKWQEATVPLRLLPLVMPLYAVSTFFISALQGIGRADLVLRNMIWMAVIMPLCFTIGSYYGLLGLSLAWLLGFPAVFLVNLRYSLPAMGMGVMDVLAAMARPALAAGIMYAMVGAAKLIALPPGAHDAVQLAVSVVTGVAAYAAFSFLLNRNGCIEVWTTFRHH